MTEAILRYLGSLEQGVRVQSGTVPPAESIIELCPDDLFPDYDTEPIMAYANG